MGDGGKSGPPKSPPGNAEIFLAFRETTQTTAVRTPRFGLKEEFGLPLATNGNDAETAVKPKETQRLSSRKNRRRRAENLSGTLFGRYVRRFFVDRTTAFNESATRGVQAFLPLAAQIVSSRRNVRALRRIVRKFAPTRRASSRASEIASADVGVNARTGATSAASVHSSSFLRLRRVGRFCAARRFSKSESIFCVLLNASYSATAFSSA